MMNIRLFQLINSWAGQNIWLDRLMIFYAEWLGYFLIGGLIICLIKDRKKYSDMLIVSLGSAIIARFIFVEIIRFLYYNPRPFLVLSDVTQLINHETVSSFPSGHASFYFALATGVYLYNKKSDLSARAGYVYFALAGLIGFSRIFAGAHWPADIVAGAILGIFTTILVSYLKHRVTRVTVLGFLKLLRFEKPNKIGPM